MESAFSASPGCFGAPLQVEMGTPVSSSLGSMGSLLGKLCLLLGHECKMQKGVKDEIKLLKETLDKSSNFLLKLSAVEDPNLTAKYWMKEVRELSYDIEDYFDKLMHVDASDANIGSVRKYTGLETARLPKAVKRRISKFRTRVQEAIQRHERYKIRDSTFRPMYASVGPQLPTVYAETAGLLDDPFNELVKWLTDGEEQQLKVVSIVGSGGLGKTTLVKQLYKNLGGAFECRAFVRVSQKPDMMRLLWSMLSQVQRQQPRDTREVQDLLDNLREHLQDKRYLIVIDDIWTVPIWDILYHAFPEGSNNGSRIITTTQIEDVALACCSSHTEYIFKMEPLSEGNSRKLFFSRVFGSEDACPEQFKEVSYEIIKKCGGLPLATINVASFLAAQPVMLMEQWNHVLNSLGSNLRANPSSEGMRQVLNLSYANLPHYLKTCLLYLSIYPDDYTIQKDDLVKQWVAEGFINAVKGQEMDETASSYFDELVNRRMIQPINVNYNDEVLSCTLHDNVIDLVAHRAMEENFMTVIDYSQNNIGFSDKVRRLSLHFDSAKYATTLAGLRLSQVRSLAFFGLLKCMPSVLEFKLLRVLILEFWGNPENMSANFTGISILLQLRYIKIACDVTVELPARMQGLQYLETLEIDARVATVPSDIVHLPFLSHICFPADTSLPNCLGLLLEYLGSLKSVILVTRSSDTTISCDGWRDVSTPPLLLERLELAPRVCIFPRFPDWITHLDKLSTLKITVRELLLIDIHILARLPSLTVLSLNVRTAPVGRIVFCSMTFPLLKCFKFRCSAPCLTFEAGALPKLRRLKLGFNAHEAEKYSPAYVGIEHLLSLVEVTGLIGGSGSNEAAESALKDTIKVHPNRPTLNIHWVDSIFQVEEADSRTAQEESYGTLEKQRDTQENDSNEHLTQEHVSNKQHGVQEINSEEDLNEQSDRSYENETNEQHETEENDSNEQHGVQEQNSEEDAKKQIDSSYENETNEQYETQENDSNEQHGVQELNSGEDMNKQIDSRSPHLLDLSETSPSHIPGSDREISPMAEIVKMQADVSACNLNLGIGNSPLSDRLATSTSQVLNSGTGGFRYLLCSSQGSASSLESSITFDFELLWRLRKYLVLLGILAVSVTYNAGLTPPRIIWMKYTYGHTAGDPVRPVHFFQRYEVFFYCNATAFAASLVLIILLLSMGVTRQNLWICLIKFTMTLDLFSLMGAYAAGSFRTLESSIYLLVLAFAVFIYVGIHTLVTIRVLPKWLKEKVTQRSSRQEEDVKEARKFILLLATSAATVTYEAGLSPPGGLLRNKYLRRYNIFVSCNSTSFVASLVTIILLLSPQLSKHGIRSKAVIACVVADLLGLIGAYAAGCCWDVETSFHVMFFTIIVWISFAVLAEIFVYKPVANWLEKMKSDTYWLEKMKSHSLKCMDRVGRVFSLELGSNRSSDTDQVIHRQTAGHVTDAQEEGNVFEPEQQTSYHQQIPTIKEGESHGKHQSPGEQQTASIEGVISSEHLSANDQQYTCSKDVVCNLEDQSKDCQSDAKQSMSNTEHPSMNCQQAISTKDGTGYPEHQSADNNQDANKKEQSSSTDDFKTKNTKDGMSNPERPYADSQQDANMEEQSSSTVDLKTTNAKDGMSNPDHRSADSQQVVSTKEQSTSTDDVNTTEIPVEKVSSDVPAGASEIETVETNNNTRSFVNVNIDRNEGAPSKDDSNENADGNSTDEHLNNSRTYLLPAILAVFLTYQSVLNPPGGFWTRGENQHSAGDLILVDSRLLVDSRRWRYIAFFYLNAIAFVASLVMIIMLLNMRMSNNCALQIAMIVDLLALAEAYIMGSCRETKNCIDNSVLVLVLAYVAVHVLRAIHVIPEGWKNQVAEKLEHFSCRHVWQFFCTKEIRRETASELQEGSDLQEKKVRKRNKYLMLLASLAPSIMYKAGLNPPGGFYFNGTFMVPIVVIMFELNWFELKQSGSKSVEVPV